MRREIARVHLPLAPRVGEDEVLVLQAGGAGHGGPEADADPVRVEPVRLQPAVGDGVAGADHGELRGPVHPADLPRAEPLRLRVEVDLTGDPRPERRGVEEGDGAGGGTALGEKAPELLGTSPAGRPYTDSGDDDAARHGRLPGLRVVPVLGIVLVPFACLTDCSPAASTSPLEPDSKRERVRHERERCLLRQGGPARRDPPIQPAGAERGSDRRARRATPGREGLPLAPIPAGEKPRVRPRREPDPI